MQRFIYVFPHLVEVFIVLWALTGSNLLSCIITTGLLAILYVYRIPQIEKSVSDQVLDGNLLPIAHRGAGDDAPENTLSAIREVC